MPDPEPLPDQPKRMLRTASAGGRVRYCAGLCYIGARFGGEVVGVAGRGELVEFYLGDALVATFPRRHDPAKEDRAYVTKPNRVQDAEGVA